MNTGTCTQQIKSTCSEHRALESTREFNRAKRKITFFVKLNDNEQLINLIFNTTNMISYFIHIEKGSIFKNYFNNCVDK